MQPFSERDGNKYFSHFERAATTLKWTKEKCSLLLQCELIGKAQEVFSALGDEQATQYDAAKKTILHTYELVTEAYQ